MNFLAVEKNLGCGGMWLGGSSCRVLPKAVRNLMQRLREGTTCYGTAPVMKDSKVSRLHTGIPFFLLKVLSEPRYRKNLL